MSDPIVEEMMSEPEVVVEPEVAEPEEPVAEEAEASEPEPVEEAPVEEPVEEPAEEVVEEPAEEVVVEEPEPEVAPKPTAEEIAQSIKAMLTRDMAPPTGNTEERLLKVEERVELLIKLVVSKNFRNLFD